MPNSSSSYHRVDTHRSSYNHHDVSSENPAADEEDSRLGEFERQLLVLQEEIQSGGLITTTATATPSVSATTILSSVKSQVTRHQHSSVPARTNSDNSMKKSSAKSSLSSSSSSCSPAALTIPGAFHVMNDDGAHPQQIQNAAGSGKWNNNNNATTTTAAASYAAVSSTAMMVVEQLHPPPAVTAATVSRRSVRFDMDPPRVIYDSKGWWFEEYAADYWYTRLDLDTFKNERKNTVKALKRNGFDLYLVERQGYVLRGFECYFSMEINQAFKYTRCLVVSLVKTEQDRQRHIQIPQPDLIRESSMCASEWARDNALQLGKKDLEEVWPVDPDERKANLLYIEDQVRDIHTRYLVNRKRKTDQPERPCIKVRNSPTTSPPLAESLVQPFAKTHISDD